MTRSHDRRSTALVGNVMPPCQPCSPRGAAPTSCSCRYKLEPLLCRRVSFSGGRFRNPRDSASSATAQPVTAPNRHCHLQVTKPQPVGHVWITSLSQSLAIVAPFLTKPSWQSSISRPPASRSAPPSGRLFFDGPMDQLTDTHLAELYNSGARLQPYWTAAAPLAPAFNFSAA